MKTLQIILFLAANLIFLTQIGRHAHQAVFGTERSVLTRYDTDFADKERARLEKNDQVLLEEYRSANEAVRTLEKGVKREGLDDLRRANTEKYDLRDSLRDEIQERERRRREVRDVWLYSGFGILLIAIGSVVYRKGVLWPGLGAVIAGFVELEYWASPTFFGGAGDSEFRFLLVNKLILSLIALLLLYVFWSLRSWPNKSLQPTPTAVMPPAGAGDHARRGRG
jgi:hypothetical protein